MPQTLELFLLHESPKQNSAENAAREAKIEKVLQYEEEEEDK